MRQGGVQDMSVLAVTRIRCPELAAFHERCMAAPLTFEGPYPLGHSSANHIHLWALEWWAERVDWIDLEYRSEFVEEIVAAWRGRLKGLGPYRARGYRVYLYQDFAPTLSIVAETEFGFPYGGTPEFVATRREVLEGYVGGRWSEKFASDPEDISPAAILKAIAAKSGSIGRPSAEALGLQVGALRRLIEQMDLGDEVNALRKGFKRTPARFREEPEMPHVFRIHEEIWPSGYR